ncbi:MAG: hypothetical protein VYE27_08515 [Pseudomonadota bacterium]|nr:hypothetical protein [Pseudomonadota bacterium]
MKISKSNNKLGLGLSLSFGLNYFLGTDPNEVFNDCLSKFFVEK